MLHVYAARMEKYGSNLSHSNAWLPRNPPTSRSKLALQNCKGDFNAWSRFLFSVSQQRFSPRVYKFILFFLTLSQHEIWKKKPRSAKTAAKLIITGIDFLNNISAGHTSLIQVYRCHKTLNRNYHEVVCEVVERASNSSTGDGVTCWAVFGLLGLFSLFVFTILTDYWAACAAQS